MWRSRTPGALLCLVLALTVAPTAAPASAGSDFLAIYATYKSTGGVDACKFTSAQLASARKGVPPDIDTYAPDFPGALDAALAQRTSGGCTKVARANAAVTRAAAATAIGLPGTGPAAGGGAAATGATAPAGVSATGATGREGTATTPAPSADAQAAPAAADDAIARAAARTGDDGGGAIPLPLALLAAVLVVALLAAAAWALVRRSGREPRWVARAGHATAEAGWRASASWAEFTDWVRLGR